MIKFIKNYQKNIVSIYKKNKTNDDWRYIASVNMNLLIENLSIFDVDIIKLEEI